MTNQQTLKDRITSASALSMAAAVVITAGFGLVFFYAPLDADQGFVQKIFYVHVPLAIWALLGFIIAGVYGIKYLRNNDAADDARSYVLIHQSIIFATTVLITGSIWAKAAWGKWWIWDEPTLVSFLIVFLLYATYYPLRYAIEDRERQARYASVFAIVAGAFVPLNFMAVRLAESLVHPRTFATAEGGLPASMGITFLVCFVGMGLMFFALIKFELEAKRTASELTKLETRLAPDYQPPVRRSAAPSQLGARMTMSARKPEGRAD